MGIELNSQFDVLTGLPLDGRTVAADITERNAIPALRRYEGLIVYVESAETNYQLVGGIDNANWEELSGSGSGDSSTFTGDLALTNNSANNLTDIGEYLINCAAIVVEYYLYRRTDSGFRRMNGLLFIQSAPDAVANPDKWVLDEAIRRERGGDSGVTFSLDDIDTEKSILVASLDNDAGAGHSCMIYYKVTKLLTGGTKYTLANNATTTMPEIGDYLANSRAIMVDYYLYRRTDSVFKLMSGQIILEGVPDEAASADRWQLDETQRRELLGDSGVSFSLTEIDTEKSILQATLDNLAGTGHICVFYYKMTPISV